MAYFYASWRQLEPEPGKFDWAGFEKKWDSPLAKGKHVILRLFLEYPNEPTGLPQWVIDSGVKRTPYDTKEVGKGLCPDWDDPRLLEALLRFVAAFGKRYNSHPRVAFIQLGTLGFWGQTHGLAGDSEKSGSGVQSGVPGCTHPCPLPLRRNEPLLAGLSRRYDPRR
jgi:hypothetical protein